VALAVVILVFTIECLILTFFLRFLRADKNRACGRWNCCVQVFMELVKKPREELHGVVLDGLFEHVVLASDRDPEMSRLELPVTSVPKTIERLSKTCNHLTFGPISALHIYLCFKGSSEKELTETRDIGQTLKSTVHVACLTEVDKSCLPIK